MENILKALHAVLAEIWIYILIIFLFFIAFKYDLYDAFNAEYTTSCLNINIPKEISKKNYFKYCQCIKNPNSKQEIEEKKIDCDKKFIRN